MRYSTGHAVRGLSHCLSLCNLAPDMHALARLFPNLQSARFCDQHAQTGATVGPEFEIRRRAKNPAAHTGEGIAKLAGFTQKSR